MVFLLCNEQYNKQKKTWYTDKIVPALGTDAKLEVFVAM